MLTSAAHILKNRKHKKKPDRTAEIQEYNNWTEKFNNFSNKFKNSGKLYCPKQRTSKLKGRLFQIILLEEQIKYWWETWTIKKAEHQRIDAFELWFWKRLLRVPWTFKWSNQSILKQIISEYSLKGLMQKLKLQQFVHLMWSTDSLEKTLMLGNIKAKEMGVTDDEIAK